LAGKQIISLDDDSTEAILCKANYAPIRDAVIEDREWTFAVKRYNFNSPDSEAPVYGYTYSHLLPAEVFRVLNIPWNERDLDVGNPDWRVEDRHIVINNAQFFARCLIRVTDPNRFTPGFVQALAIRLAHRLCIPLTQAKARKKELWDEYQDLVSASAATNGMQGRHEQKRSSELTGVR
jgi:hypothetical protein